MATMNATNVTTETMSQTPWVESGAMVYVAITVATMSAVIMCCTWFVTHNKPLQRWWNGRVQYNGIDGEEEEIQLTEAEEESEDYTDEPSSTEVTVEPSSTEAFTLDDSDDSSSQDGNEEHINAV